MDPLSHAVLGASAAMSRVRQAAKLKVALVCGIFAGTFPDLDVMIRSASDPLLSIEYHRQFTHALFFVPLGAAIVAWLIKLIIFRQEQFKLLFMFCFFSMLCHGLLDSLTNYGTHLFWPFTNRRESWSIISIVDPIFTLTLLACIIISMFRKSTKPVKVGLIFAICYWSIGLYQREAVTDELKQLANARGHTIERMEVKPSFANLWVWRGQYVADGLIYVDAYHSSPWAGKRVYEGSHYPLFQLFAEAPNTTQQQDLHRFAFFSDGWLAEFPAGSQMIADMRFSMLPNRLEPLWGIQMNDKTPEAHVDFKNVRSRSAGDVALLWQMILGKPI